VDVREMDYLTLEAPPVDGTDEPDAGEAPLQINVVSDEIEVATEEDLQIIIEQEGKVREPEIAAAEHEGAPPPPLEEGEVRTRSYISDHPTNFNWRPDVARLVNRIQKKFPNQTYANTYYWHPPYSPPAITRRYDAVSVDFWGGGVSNGRYVGYRGKPIGTQLGHQVWKALWTDPHAPNISWIIWNGRMWIRGRGWSDAPWGPPDSDAGHHKHVHVSYQ
jgi:hypothetical protein